jgi:hypothetical protein
LENCCASLRDARLEDPCQMWESQSGVKPRASTMSRAIRRAGYTRKKRRWQLPSQKQQERVARFHSSLQLDVRQLVYIDECGSTIAVLPTLRLGRYSSSEPQARSLESRRQEHDLDCLFGLGWDGGVHEYRGN